MIHVQTNTHHGTAAYKALAALDGAAARRAEETQHPMVRAAWSVLLTALRDEDAYDGAYDRETGFRYQRTDVPERRRVGIAIDAPEGEAFTIADLFALNGLHVGVSWQQGVDEPQGVEATVSASCVGELTEGGA